jgi:hypothetical protein
LLAGGAASFDIFGNQISFSNILSGNQNDVRQNNQNQNQQQNPPPYNSPQYGMGGVGSGRDPYDPNIKRDDPYPTRPRNDPYDPYAQVGRAIIYFEGNCSPNVTSLASFALRLLSLICAPSLTRLIVFAAVSERWHLRGEAVGRVRPDSAATAVPVPAVPQHRSGRPQ